MTIKRIAVLTTGGDAPGMNAAIRGVVRCALSKDIEVMGIVRGWWGLINDDVKPMDSRSVSGIINLGGTILKTARCKEFFTKEGQLRAYQTIKRHAIDALVVIGGNGSFTAAHSFYKNFKVPCVGVPVSIDNDVNGIDLTIGSDTAVNTALMAVDNIRDTATSMERVYVVEVMGRDSGYIALSVALAGGCEDVIIPEKKPNINKICDSIVEGNIRGKISWIIIVAEGAGKAVDIAKKINELTGLETRSIVLGHIQRGGRPTAFSRTIALILAQGAVDCIVKGKFNKVVGISDSKIITVDFKTAIKKKKLKIVKFYSLLEKSR